MMALFSSHSVATGKPSRKTSRRERFALALSVVSLALSSLFATQSNAQIIVGNGGDPRIIKLTNARIEAVNWTYKLTIYPQYVDNDALTPSLVRSFLSADGVLQMLAEDILSSPHIYDTEARPTCAWTNVPPPGAPSVDHVRLSLPTCGPFLTSQGRPWTVKLLIHESVHHLLRDETFRLQHGIRFEGTPQQRYDAEEEFCNHVAMAVERAFELAAREGVAHWRDVSVDNEGLDERGLHTAVWTGDTGNAMTTRRMIIWGGCRETPQAIYGCGDKYFHSGGVYAPDSDSWTRTDESTAPAPRAGHTAVWTGETNDPETRHRMIVWGGCTGGDGCANYLNDGGIYDPARNVWREIRVPASNDALRGRTNHTMLWTGKVVVIWGGQTGVNTAGGRAESLGDGAVFDPATGNWRRIPPHAAIGARAFHSAIWTGATGNPKTANRMLVWGGCDKEEYLYCTEHYADGALFDPETMDWQKLETTGVAPAARRLHTAALAPTRNMMIVWGGQGGQSDSRNLGDGAILDLATLRWQRLMGLGPEDRSRHTAVWTGDDMVIFGGETSPDRYAEKVGAYSLPASPQASGSWADVLGEYYPLKVKHHTAVWTGEAMIVWGGQVDRRAFKNTGAMFFPGIK